MARSRKKASGSVTVVSSGPLWMRRLSIRVSASREVIFTPEVATIRHARRSDSGSRTRLSSRRRTQRSTRGLWITCASGGLPSATSSATRMLKLPRKSLWTVTTAVVGRPVESVSEKANSKRRSTSRISRQNVSGRIAAWALRGPASAPAAPAVFTDVGSGDSDSSSST
jgi:hypothetical protein